MLSVSLRIRPLLLLAVSAPAVAQYVSTPPPTPAATPPPGTGDITISPKNGQTEQQQWTDRYDCHRWAVSQSGFDPTAHKGAASADSDPRLEQYQRALTACLEGRGYSVQYGAQPSAAAPPPPASAAPATRLVPVESAVKYHPLSLQIGGGYTVTTGDTNDYLHNGGNVGLGLTWFPIEALPVGVRADGSYSWFGIRNNTLAPSGSDYSQGHEYVYGGDADLQFDLAHHSERTKMYLFGGVGWYREQLHTREISFQSGTVCGFFYCFPGQYPVVTGVDRTTSPWHSSWNAGLGWQYSAPGGGPSFFIEARYLRIAPRDSRTEFVPITVGLRF
jgi:hypothetical protein